MLRFDNYEDFVEIGLASQESAELPSRDDAYVTIRISSAGFAGHNDLWVLGAVFRSFCHSLVAMERERRGEAVLESISPNELRLVVHSVGSRGHMAVEGCTGYAVQLENIRAWHSVTFGFEFDPSQLVRAASVEWVQQNAESGGAANRGQSVRSQTNRRSSPAGPCR